MNEKIAGTVKNPHAIVRLSVEKLFGQFNYQLPMKDADQPDLSSLFILYGDNGSGKTTLLRLLFHLLSPEPGKGHKTAVGGIRFRRFSVELADGTIIEALRVGKSLGGPYRASIIKDSVTVDSFDFPGNDFAKTEEGQARLMRFLGWLDKLALSLHFLPDDRRIQGPSREDHERTHRPVRPLSGEFVVLSQWVDDEEPSPADMALRAAVGRASRWFRQQALEGSNLGQQNVNSIYQGIVTQIATSPAGDARDIQSKTEKLVENLGQLSERSKAYSRFGLTSDLPVEKLIEAVEAAPPDKKQICYTVLKPYAQGIEARLKALEGVHNLMETFLENINTFFGPRKSVTFNLQEGLRVWTKRKEPLDLDMLSSGEKQLLLLLCNTLASRDRARIFIIDEPEISLNIKWQRQLVRALLDCIRGTRSQLIFATHSIELLTGHRQHVVKLIDQNEVESPEENQEEPEEDEDERRRQADDRRIESHL